MHRMFNYLKQRNYQQKDYCYYKEDIDLDNRRRFHTFTILVASLMILFLLVSLIVPFKGDIHYPYFIAVILSISVYYLNENTIKYNYKNINFIYYLFIIGIFLTLTSVGINHNVNSTASTIYGLYVFFPILFMDKPSKFSMIMTLLTMYFCINTLLLKTIDYALVDCYNALIFNFLGIVLSYYFFNNRIIVISNQLKITNQRDTDYLTGLKNRLAIEEKIKCYLTYTKENAALFMIDLDNFKRINDQYGHLAGDRVLIQVADILKNIFNRDDFISRIGGDEFIVFIPHCSDINYVEEKALEMIESIYNIIDNKDIDLGCSVGICFRNENDDYNLLFNSADQAMYEAKSCGKNCYRLYK